MLMLDFSILRMRSQIGGLAKDKEMSVNKQLRRGVDCGDASPEVGKCEPRDTLYSLSRLFQERLEFMNKKTRRR